jgi:uracil-DNA glycosylase family 4
MTDTIELAPEMIGAITVAEINREVIKRCQHLGLEFDCGADGIVNTEVAIIAEAPGERERILKIPLAGGSGKLLWDTLRRYGINRRNVYISNVSKRQLLNVTGDKGGTKKDIGSGELQMYSSLLQWELAQLPNLKYVVCLGNIALQAVTGLTGITQYRGSVLDTQLKWNRNNTEGVRDVKVLAMNNPAAVIREPKNELTFRFDCKRLNDVLQGEFKHYDIEHIINPSFNDAMDWIRDMRMAGLPVGLDIETSSGETIAVGLANDAHRGMCINFRTADANRWTVDEEAQLWQAIQELVTDPQVRLVMQNGMYDSSWLWFIDRCKVTRQWFDTMLAHHTLYPIMPHNLGFLTTQYTTHPFYKDEGKVWKETGDIDAEWRYNVKDVCIMLKCQQLMLKELEDQNMSEFFFSHVMPLQPELIDMTVHGVLVDQELKQQISEDMKRDIEQLRSDYFAKVRSLTGDADYRPNPASPKQMAGLFFDRLHLVGRGVATDKENRRRMREHPRTPDGAKHLLLHIDKLAEETKFASTYAEMTIDTDGRVRSEYKQMGVQRAPGRLSSASTGWGTGTNLQNQPGRAHSMFIADPGYEFSYFDLGQAEARVVGWRYAIHHWMADFERARTEGGYDAHRALAAIMFNKPYEETPIEDWDEDHKPTIRYIAKRCRHGLNYRMMPDKLATVMEIPYNQADYLWHLYHKVNPELEKGWQWDVKTVQDTRQLFNAYGRRWMLMERFSDEATESIVAFYPQSTIGDKVSRIIRLCHNDPEWPRNEARICLNIHDALVSLHRSGHGPTVRAIMKRHALEPLYIKCIDGETRELTIPCDLKASLPDERGFHRWSTLAKVTE